MYTYEAKIIAVYDGDTCTAVVDLGFRIKYEIKLRLAHINTPEVRGPQRPEGLKARDFLRKLILGKTVQIRTMKDKQEKYGRYLADIYLLGVKLPENNYVNAIMIENGYAEEYEGGARS